jgi:hypothetical protein
LKSSIKVQLLAVLAVLGVTLFLTNVAAWWGQTRASASLETIYNDRVVPLRDLKDISDAYAVSIVDATHKVRSREFSWLEGAQAVSSASTRIDKLWRSIGVHIIIVILPNVVVKERTRACIITTISELYKVAGIPALHHLIYTGLKRSAGAYVIALPFTW